MSYEDAKYIGELNASYPEDNVSASGGAQHIRMLKDLLRKAFENTDQIPIDFAELVDKEFVEDRYPIVGSGDPNGAETPIYRGHIYFDKSTDPWTKYIGLEAEDDNSWVSESRLKGLTTDSLTAQSSASLPEDTTVGGSSIQSLSESIKPVFSSGGTSLETVYWNTIDSEDQSSWTTVSIDNIFDSPKDVQLLVLQIRCSFKATGDNSGVDMWMKNANEDDTDRNLFNLALAGGRDIDNGDHITAYNGAVYFMAVKGYETTDFDFNIRHRNHDSIDLLIKLVGYL